MDSVNEEKMENTINLLEAKFQKAESDINLIERKITAEFSASQDKDKKINPTKVLERLDGIKKEYSALMQETIEIKKSQEEMMAFFQSHIAQASEAIRQIQLQTNAEIEDNEEEKKCAEEGLKLPKNDEPQDKAEEKLGGTFDVNSIKNSLP